jgi:hypothetical protein
MQLALHMCLLFDNQASHASLEEKIDLFLQETWKTRDLLEAHPSSNNASINHAESSRRPRYFGDSPRADAEEGQVDLAFDVKVFERLTNVLEAAKSVTATSTNQDSISNSSSRASISEETRAAIENWIWDKSGPSTWVKLEANLPSDKQKQSSFFSTEVQM